MAEIVTSPPLHENAKALRKTALHATHRQHKANMVDFGGWDMPVAVLRPHRRAHGRPHRRRPLRRLAHGRHPVPRPRLPRRRQEAADERRHQAPGRPGALLRHALPRTAPSSTTSSSTSSAKTTTSSSSTPAPARRTSSGSASRSARMPGVHITDFSRLLHPARHPGPQGRGHAAEAHRHRPQRHQELLVHLGQGLRPATTS